MPLTGGTLSGALIGTNITANALYVNSFLSMDRLLISEGSSNGDLSINYSNGATNSAVAFYAGDVTAVFTIDNGGRVNANEFSGNHFYKTSDRRLKTNITYLDTIENIENIKIASYIKDGKKQIGYIAQDVENILPSAVNNNGGYLSLAYEEILIAKIAYLERKIIELENGRIIR